MKVSFGVDTYEFPSEELGYLAESDKGEDPSVLNRRFREDGYLFIRNLLDRDAVLKSRETVMTYMSEKGVLTPGKPILHGVMPRDARAVPLMGYKGITHRSEVLATLESPLLFSFFGRLFGEPAMTFDYKWLRAVGHEKYTGAHYDVVYMGRGSLNARTVWIPLGDIPVEHGTLAVCRGSHNEPGFKRLRETYGRMDVDRDRVEGWFSESPREITSRFGGKWLTHDFRAGDILLFGLFTMHGATTNGTDRYRLSCDVRYQPASEPADERWIGENPGAHSEWFRGERISMSEARAAWKI